MLCRGAPDLVLREHLVRESTSVVLGSTRFCVGGAQKLGLCSKEHQSSYVAMVIT